LDEDNNLYIISVYKGKKNSYNNFIKEYNRINLFNIFTLERLTDEELRVNNKAKIINKVKEIKFVFDSSEMILNTTVERIHVVTAYDEIIFS
jgi:hypothetical protein